MTGDKEEIKTLRFIWRKMKGRTWRKMINFHFSLSLSLMFFFSNLLYSVSKGGKQKREIERSLSSYKHAALQAVSTTTSHTCGVMEGGGRDEEGEMEGWRKQQVLFYAFSHGVLTLVCMRVSEICVCIVSHSVCLSVKPHMTFSFPNFHQYSLCL